jgi:hypothetical protein
MQLRPNDDSVIFKLSIPENKVIITDSEKWGYVVNFMYLPKGEDDYKKHKDTLKKYNISDPTEIIMGDKGNFYPQLKKKIEKSWDRLFEDYSISDVRQGTIWEIREEDIIEIIKES